MQHQTDCCDSACFCWLNPKTPEAVPTPLCNSNAAFNSGSCGALRKVVVLFFPGRGIRKGSHQPVSKHVSTVSQQVSSDRLVVAFEDFKQSRIQESCTQPGHFAMTLMNSKSESHTTCTQKERTVKITAQDFTKSLFLD